MNAFCLSWSALNRKPLTLWKEQPSRLSSLRMPPWENLRPKVFSTLDPVAHLGGTAEAASGDLVLESVELRGRQSAGVTLVLQGAEGLQTLGPEEGDPVLDRPRANAEQVSDLLCRIALV